MSEKGSLLVGFDLCNDYSQITCYNRKTFEPDSICQTEDQSKYLIPTVLGVREDTKDWVYGEEATTLFNQGKAILVEDIIESITRNEERTIHNVTFTGTALLERFLRKCLVLLKRYYPTDSIQFLIVTVKEQSILLRDALYEALAGIGITKERVSLQSHTNSYLCYALSQEKELWWNDIGLFDFDEEGLHYSQITINRKTEPMIAMTTEKDFSDILSYELFTNKNPNDLTYIFENITKSTLYKQIISALYLTGIGFEGNWADEIIEKLCIGRRVFKGQNLYAKGACYAARELTEEGKLTKFLFLSEEMLQHEIAIKVYYNAKMTEFIVAEVGAFWVEATNSVEVILDAEDEIEIITRNMVKHEEKRQMITLDGLRSAPNKTIRVQIKSSFMDKNSCVITVKDMGFGEFYPTSNRIWEKVLQLEEGVEGS